MSATTVDNDMMELALREAERILDTGKTGGVAALMRWKEGVLAFGHNEIEETNDCTNHAEMVVLRKASKWLSLMTPEERRDITMYVTLEPCLMCFAAISFAGLGRIVYSATNNDAIEDAWIARDISNTMINEKLVRGPLELIGGIQHERGVELLRRMNLAADPHKAA